MKTYLTVVSGLACKLDGTAHAIGSAAATTGAPLSGAAVSAPSIDQLIADLMAGDVPFRSLEVGVNPFSPFGDLHSIHTVSHSGPNLRNLPDVDPQAVFSRLFGATAATAEEQRISRVRRSILDSILADGRRLQRGLGVRDRQRVEAHLDAVRAIERRLETGPSEENGGPRLPREPTVGIDATNEAPPAVNSVMAELTTIALAMEKTRVASFMFTLPGAHVHYRHLGPDMDDDFHDTICHGDFGTRSEQPRVDTGVRYTMRCLNEFATKLRDTPHGAGNLLDATLMYVTSCVGWGRHHDHAEWPVLLLGKANGRLRGDAHHRFDGGNLSCILLTMLQVMGSERQTFGMDAGFTAEALPGIFA